VTTTCVMRRALERTMAEVERLKAELNCKPEACDMPDACGYAIENAALREQLAENTRKWAHAEVEIAALRGGLQSPACVCGETSARKALARAKEVKP